MNAHTIQKAQRIERLADETRNSDDPLTPEDVEDLLGVSVQTAREYMDELGERDEFCREGRFENSQDRAVIRVRE